MDEENTVVECNEENLTEVDCFPVIKRAKRTGKAKHSQIFMYSLRKMGKIIMEQYDEREGDE